MSITDTPNEQKNTWSYVISLPISLECLHANSGALTCNIQVHSYGVCVVDHCPKRLLHLIQMGRFLLMLLFPWNSTFTIAHLDVHVFLCLKIDAQLLITPSNIPAVSFKLFRSFPAKSIGSNPAAWCWAFSGIKSYGLGVGGSGDGILVVSAVRWSGGQCGGSTGCSLFGELLGVMSSVNFIFGLIHSVSRRHCRCNE